MNQIAILMLAIRTYASGCHIHINTHVNIIPESIADTMVLNLAFLAICLGDWIREKTTGI